MKSILFLALCFLFFSNTSLAQASETFDIATFQPPAGWKKQNKLGVVIFSTSNEQKGTYAMITLYPSGISSGNPKIDFETDWQEFVAGQMGVKTKPEFEPAKTAESWAIITGSAAFENDLGPAAVLMNTYSGHGRAFSAAVVFNSPDYVPSIEAFAASIKLKKPEPTAGRQTEQGTDAVAVVGIWGATSSDQSSFAVNHGISGYITRQYTFYPNGTYEFLGKLFAYTSRELLFTKETGTYQLNGNSLTISPQRSVIQAYTKATVIGANGRPAETDNWGKLVSTQSRPIEKVTYRISKVYMSGTEKWQLRLESAKPTGRDGPFTGSSTFPNTWFYETQRFPIEPPK